MKNIFLISAVVLSAAMLTACGKSSGDSQTASGTITLEQPVNSEMRINEIETQTETTSETQSETISEFSAISESSEMSAETSSVAETTAEADTLPEKDEAEEITSVEETEISTSAESTAALTDAAAAAYDFSMESPVKIIYNGQCVSLRDITDVKSFFGKTISPEISAPSCMGEGEDIIYTYDDFVVTAFVSESGTVQITSIISTGMSIENPTGLSVGMSEEEALDVLGTYKYEEEGQCVSFLTDNSIVIEIDYMVI